MAWSIWSWVSVRGAWDRTISAALLRAGGIRGSRLALSARWFHFSTMSPRAVSQASNAPR